MDIHAWKNVLEELAVLRQAPFAVVVLVLLVSAIVLTFVRSFYGQRLTIANDRIEALKERLNFGSTGDVRAREAPPPRTSFATRDRLGTPAIRNLTFRIIDVLGDEPGAEIRDKVFEDCDVYGPAILLFGRNLIFERNEFVGPFEALAWEIPPYRPEVVGVIQISNVTFRRCRFHGVGLAGNAAEMAHLRDSMIGPLPPDLRHR